MKFLVAGDLILDHSIEGQVSRVSPEAPIPILNYESEDYSLGGAGNAAHNLAALDCTSTLVGVLGSDANSRVYSKLCQKQKINLLPLFDEKQTICKQRFSSGQQLLRVDRETIRDSAHPQLLSTLKKQSKLHDVLILSDYNKGALQDIAAIIKIAKQQNMLVFVDPKGNDFSKYRGADFLTPNKKEFETVYGSCATRSALIAKAKKAVKQLRCQAMIITLGSQGVLAVTKREEYYYPTIAHEVSDVTGAGDTFIAHLAFWLAQKHQLNKALEQANAASGCAVAKRGVATVSIHEYTSVSKKITQEYLPGLIKTIRQQKKTIAFTNGCFDTIHAGHIASLNEARRQCDVLIVAVNSDSSVSRLKGSDRPLHCLAHRLEVLSALKPVDYLIPFSSSTPLPLIRKIKPDVLLKGEDYKNKNIVGKEFVQSYGGRVHYTSFIPGLSSSKSIDFMKNAAVQKK